MRPLRGRRLTVARGSPVTSSGIAATHDVAFAGVGLSPDQQDVTYAHACVAHGVAFHAVGEVVPVLEVEASLGKSVLDRLHGGGRSSGDRKLRQVHVDVWPWPFLPAYFHEVSGG